MFSVAISTLYGRTSKKTENFVFFFCSFGFCSNILSSIKLFSLALTFYRCDFYTSTISWWCVRMSVITVILPSVLLLLAILTNRITKHIFTTMALFFCGQFVLLSLREQEPETEREAHLQRTFTVRYCSFPSGRLFQFDRRKMYLGFFLSLIFFNFEFNNNFRFYTHRTHAQTERQ